MRLKAKKITLGLLATLLSVTGHSATLKWGGARDIYSLDPYSYGSTSNIAFLNHIYEGLVRYTPDFKIEPALATDWTLIDNKYWRFTLRRGVKFHDGADFTSADVIASLKRVSHPSSPLRGNLPFYVSAKAVDDYTVDIEVSSPTTLFLNDLTNIHIFDEGWLIKNKAELPTSVGDRIEGYPTFNTNGTGPFILESRVPDSKTVMNKNPSWWDSPKHNIDSIEFMPILAPATRVAALLSGEVSLIDGVPLQDIKRLQSTSGITVIQRPDLRNVAIYFNRHPKLSDGRDNFFNDIRFRQAIDHAIDRELIAKRIMRGTVNPAGTVVAPEIPGYSSTLDIPTRFDPELSKKLLAEAGLSGTEFTYLCMTDESVNEEEVCSAIVSMLSRVGLKVRLDIGPRSVQTPKRSSGQADMYMAGWANEPTLDAYSILVQVLSTRSGASGVLNYGGLSYPEIDALTKQISKEADPQKRLALEAQALGIVKKEVLMIPLHQQPMAWAHNNKVDTVVVKADNKPRHWLTRLR